MTCSLSQWERVGVRACGSRKNTLDFSQTEMREDSNERSPFAPGTKNEIRVDLSHRGAAFPDRFGRCPLLNRPASHWPELALHNHFRLFRSSQQSLRANRIRSFGGSRRF